MTKFNPPRVIPHQKPSRKAPKPKRYAVEYLRDWGTGSVWVVYSTHRFAWKAKSDARIYDSFGYSKHRVVDTRG